MNITSANHMSGSMSAVQGNKSNQDSHEKNIKNQITNLQGKMRDLSYNTQMSTDEKSDEKKKLQEQIHNLNSELKRYQIQKRREEAEKKQTEAKKSDESVKKSSTDRTVVNDNEAAASAAGDIDDTATPLTLSGTENVRNTESPAQQGRPELGLDGTESEMMISFSNTKKQLSNMEKIQTNLTGLMRTAETDEEKLKLQKKIDSVSSIIEDKAKKTADKLAESREEDEKKKKKIREMLKEQEARRANMKAAVPKSGKSVFGDNQDGKVLLTRKK